MRFISGIIVGVVLTVGTAYVHDQRAYRAGETQTLEPPAAVAAGRIVNWDVLGAVTRKQATVIRRKFNELVGS